jgi:hypothetical protein
MQFPIQVFDDLCRLAKACFVIEYREIRLAEDGCPSPDQLLCPRGLLEAHSDSMHRVSEEASG